jgi:hypothetical protein
MQPADLDRSVRCVDDDFDDAVATISRPWLAGRRRHDIRS